MSTPDKEVEHDAKVRRLSRLAARCTRCASCWSG
jgi:hypothetical protein